MAAFFTRTSDGSCRVRSRRLRGGVGGGRRNTTDLDSAQAAGRVTVEAPISSCAHGYDRGLRGAAPAPPGRGLPDPRIDGRRGGRAPGRLDAVVAHRRGQRANPEAYLVTVVGRRATDFLRAAKRRRETYTGPWLPEPVANEPDPALDPAAAAELADSLSMALLVVLETLSPLERAAFVLREVFDRPYAEVAAAFGRSEQAVRQLVHRARGRVDDGHARFSADATTPRRRSSAGSSPRAKAPTSRRCWRCWRPTSSSSATAAARPRPRDGRCTGGQGGPAARRLRGAGAGGPHVRAGVLQRVRSASWRGSTGGRSPRWP